MLVPDRIEEEIKRLYQLARANPEDENLRTAVQIVKTVRRSRGSLQGWNNRYREDIQSLNDQILLQEQEKARFQSELYSIIEQRQLIEAQRDKAKAELRKIETEANIAAAKIRENHSWYGKFMILWNFVRVVFDVPPDIDSNGILDNPKNPNSPTIINDLDDLRDKSGMRTDSASIQRDLLDR
jgi:predicted trehalose synthase